MRICKRIISLLVVLLLCITALDYSYAISALDDEIIVVDEMLTELCVVSTISTYFDQRLSFLRGYSDTISVAIQPIVNNELIHREAMNQNNISIVSSTFSIERIDIWDNLAETEVIESVVYNVGQEVVERSIVHRIDVYLNLQSIVVISSDGYIDDVADFASCSYISCSEISANVLELEGSGLCMIEVASSQVGYSEGSDGYTIYGAYTGFPYENWCASFVSWCANEVGISRDIIPNTASVYWIKEAMADHDAYYMSYAQGGTYVPEPGDLFFQRDTVTIPGHVGIVVRVEGNMMYVIDGNYHDSVQYRSIPLTQSDLIGFGKPDYVITSHSWGVWYCNSITHWKVCAYCDAIGCEDEHDAEFVQIGQPYICTVCGHEVYSQIVN